MTTQARSSKLQKILDIWKHGDGVASLHCFHSALAAEAFTREACMVEAVGMCIIHCKGHGVSASINCLQAYPTSPISREDNIMASVHHGQYRRRDNLESTFFTKLITCTSLRVYSQYFPKTCNLLTCKYLCVCLVSPLPIVAFCIYLGFCIHNRCIGNL